MRYSYVRAVTVSLVETQAHPLCEPRSSLPFPAAPRRDPSSSPACLRPPSRSLPIHPHSARPSPTPPIGILPSPTTPARAPTSLRRTFQAPTTPATPPIAIGHPNTLSTACEAEGSKLAGQSSSPNLLVMRRRIKPSISSRTSVRSLIVACMPATVLGVVANSPALGAIFNQPASQCPAVVDKAVASLKAPSTNRIGNTTNNNEQVPICIQGIRG